MKLRALCLIVLLLGCSTATPPTGPERALLERVAQIDDGCAPTSVTPDNRTCDVYIIMNDQSMGWLCEVRNGVPYVEPSLGGDRVRYGLWIGAMTTYHLEIDRYVGQHDQEYELSRYYFLGQEPRDIASST